jgi:hypothetical protein
MSDDTPDWRRFREGDIVTRGGDDLQRITELDEDNHCLTVVCTRAPASGWCKVGDVERNLSRRYCYATDAIEGVIVQPPKSLPPPEREA